MEVVNIKDYLAISEQDKGKKTKKPVEYTFEKIFDNGSDFIIERSNSRNIKRQLCFIASEDLLFIRNPKNGTDETIKSESQIKNFFSIDNNVNSLEFKNGYFQTDSAATLAYRLCRIHNSKNGLRRFFIQYGYNPEDYLWKSSWAGEALFDAIGRFPFNETLRIIKVVEEYRPVLQKKDGDYKPQLNAEFFLFLMRIQELYSIDYVKIFLEIFCSYDTAFNPTMNNYYDGGRNDIYKCLSFEKPLKDFNLDFKRYCTYLFRDLYSQGIAEVDSGILETYYDTLKMQKDVYEKVKDKYPEHLKETHDKTVLIYNLNKAYFLEKKVEALNIHNKELEMSDKDYSIIVAKTSQDLITEGINLHHCVGSYVDKVNNAECSIFFLRKTDDIDTSLITIEVREDRVCQVRGLCERLMNDEERKFFKKWIAKKGLTFVRE